MVEFFLAKEGIRVRFPLAAPKENTHNVGVFFWTGSIGNRTKFDSDLHFSRS